VLPIRDVLSRMRIWTLSSRIRILTCFHPGSYIKSGMHNFFSCLPYGSRSKVCHIQKDPRSGKKFIPDPDTIVHCTVNSPITFRSIYNENILVKVEISVLIAKFWYRNRNSDIEIRIEISTKLTYNLVGISISSKFKKRAFGETLHWTRYSWKKTVSDWTAV
jgi:hypothetical protein